VDIKRNKFYKRVWKLFSCPLDKNEPSPARKENLSSMMKE